MKDIGKSLGRVWKSIKKEKGKAKNQPPPTAVAQSGDNNSTDNRPAMSSATNVSLAQDTNESGMERQNVSLNNPFPLHHPISNDIALSVSPIAEDESPADTGLPKDFMAKICVGNPATDEGNVSRALSELKRVVADFKQNYEQFIKTNPHIVRLEEDLDGAIEKSGTAAGMTKSAQIFQSEISATLSAIEKKQKLAKGKWTGRLGDFLAKLYPVARLSLSLAGAIAEVLPP